MSIKINEIDVSEYFGDEGADIQSTKIYGKNGGMLLSGTRIIDLLSNKINETISSNLLTPLQLSTLMSLVREETSTVEIFDATINAVRSFKAELDATITTIVPKEYYALKLSISEV